MIGIDKIKQYLGILANVSNVSQKSCNFREKFLDDYN
jgi:hypothetical protein